MKKIFINILASAAVVLSAASCDLELFPDGALNYEPGNSILSESDLEGFEAGVMNSLRGIEYGVYDQATEIMVDYFNAVADYGNNYGDIHRVSYTSGNYEVEYNWADPYEAIKNFNIAIEECLSCPSELAEGAAILRGESYFARAFAYLHMIRLFGAAYNSSTASTDLGIPIVLVYDQSARPARNTVQEVYDQIKCDLDSAAVLLANVKGEVRAQYPTIDAVNALYARYYLDTKQYSAAAEAAMSVIGTGNYALSSTTDEMDGEWIDDNGTEPIMQYYASTSEGLGYHTYISPTCSTDSDGYYYYSTYFLPNQDLLDAYEDSDLRYQRWFTSCPDEYTTGSYSIEVRSIRANGSYYSDGELTVFCKYRGNGNYRTSRTPNGAQAIKPFLISEMYLIAAEAYFQSGQTSAAQTQLNALQSARGASTTTATLANIQKEWYKETVGEGLRMSCLKRWGLGYSSRPGQTTAVSRSILLTGSDYTEKSLPADDYHFLFPIPLYEMQTNLNLVQNAGYASTEE